ncbi:MAG: SurA N-terminal domain-containing protein [Gammaproteobacteria bacterium]|nr:SurA N-terminal domain-containing protein [Gammaproteobacteria bacterium]
MLERIREGSQGIVAKSILGLVILTFAISGIGSYISNQADTALAVVNDVEIGQSSFENAYQNERARMEQQFGAMFEQLLADENYVANFRKNILDRLVVEELQKQNAQALGVRVGDEQVRDAILMMPEFQQNGEFNNDVYVALLRQAGFQPAQFREYMREQIALTQYNNAVFSTDFVLPGEVEAFNQLANQTRSFDLVTFSVDALKAEVTAEQAELEEYFAANKLMYQTQEQVAVEYIVIDGSELASQVNVTDEELETYYEQNIIDYTQSEQRRLAHVLVEAGDDVDAAKAKIAEAQAELNSGKSFAYVAKEFSDDTFSAENGGDLDWVEPGVMGDEFDAAAFELANVNDVTDIVETDFGFHLIQLTELKPEVVQSFADVKDDIKSTLSSDKAAELYIEAQTKAVETAFEIPDTLQDAAANAGIQLKTTGLVSRSELPADLAQVQVVTKLFDEDFIAEGMNSDLIELDENKSIIVRVNEHKAPQQQSLEEVKEAVTAAVVANKAQELAQSKAEEVLSKAQSGETLAAQGVELTRKDNIKRTDRSIDNNIAESVFALPKPEAGQVEYELVNMLNGDVAVVALDEVAQAEVADATQSQAQLNSLLARIASQAYVEALKANAEVEIRTVQ